MKWYPNQNYKKITPTKYKYKTTECLEQHGKLQNSQHGKDKVHELKERNYGAVFRKREHKCWNNRGKDTCVDLYRVINEDIKKPSICR